MQRKHSNVALFVPHSGCPNMCSFCNQRIISGQTVQPTQTDVFEAAKRAYECGVNPSDTEIAFFGGSFTAIERGYMVSLLEAAHECLNKYGFAGIRISTRPDCIDNEVLTLLKRYGVTVIELGAQSMDDTVLAANKRGHTSADTVNACGLIRAYGFSLGLQMMTGLYMSTPATDKMTCDRLISLSPDCVRIYPTVVLKGTELDTLFSVGQYTPQTVDEAASLCAELILAFEKAGITIIRVGLHASEGVSSDMTAGAYHPAFREICESRIFLNKIEDNIPQSGSYEVFVAPDMISKATGQKRANILLLEKRKIHIKITPDGNLSGRDIRVVAL